MVKVNVTACDVCRKTEAEIEIVSWTFTSGTDRWKVDLCTEHSEPVQELIQRVERSKVRRRPKFEDVSVSSPDEIPRI